MQNLNNKKINNIYTNNSNKIHSAGILGTSGIGKVHARIYTKLGIKRISILNRSLESSIESQKEIEDTCNIKVDICTSINHMMEESKPTLISVCTPPENHYESFITLCSYPVSIFCEKPFFWEQNLDSTEFNNRLTSIMSHKDKNIMVNTSNASLITQLKNHIHIDEKINSFHFTFNTNGQYRNNDIGIDLLPHALSLLIELCGHKKLHSLKREIKEDSYSCKFSYGDIDVFFSFIQKSDIEKKLSFSINGNNYLRVQKNEDKNYRVFLYNHNSNKSFELIDPFEFYIKRFIQNHLDFNALSTKNHLNDSILNMQLLYKII